MNRSITVFQNRISSCFYKFMSSDCWDFLIKGSQRHYFSQIFADETQIFAETVTYSIQKTTENKISYDIRGAAFKVHNTLGPGLLESVYESALSHELLKMGYDIQNHLGIPMKYDTIEFKFGFR